MTEVVRQLTAIYEETSSVPLVSTAYEYWLRYRESTVNQSALSPHKFVEETYLALLARAVSRHFFGPVQGPSDPDELWQVVNGDYFVRYGLENFISEDFFTWPFFRRSLGIGPDHDAIGVVRDLSSRLSQFDISQSPPSLLTGLFHQLTLNEEATPQDPPVWLAEFLLEDRLELAQRPEQSVLDPSCGAGTILAAAISIKVRSLRAQGKGALDALIQITAQVVGMTTDPLAATIAKTSYLLALGDLTREPHPPVLVPVYLADAAAESETGVDVAGSPVYSFAVAQGLKLPERVVCDPILLDWLFGRLPNYMKGAAVRLHSQPEEVAVQEVLNAYYNYLTSPKARTPIPEALTPLAADVMVEAARKLILGYLHGDGHTLLHIIKNAPAAIFLSTHNFDLLVGTGQRNTTPSDLQKWENWQTRYLKESGRGVFVSSTHASDSPRFEYAVARPGQGLIGSGASVRINGNIPTEHLGWSVVKGLNVVQFDAL